MIQLNLKFYKTAETKGFLQFFSETINFITLCLSFFFMQIFVQFRKYK